MQAAANTAGSSRDEPRRARNDSMGQIRMKDHSRSDPAADPAPATASQDAPDLLQGRSAFRKVRPTDHDIGDDDDTARLPRITSLPEGIEVIEHSVCRAVGQWVLMVRCQCGKRWFELEAIDAATCPRCNTLVYVDVLLPRPD